jgi:hypothetical protein
MLSCGWLAKHVTVVALKTTTNKIKVTREISDSEAGEYEDDTLLRFATSVYFDETIWGYIYGRLSTS